MNSFGDLVGQLRRRAFYAAVVTIAIIFVPFLAAVAPNLHPRSGMIGLGEDPFAALKWSEWLIWTTLTCYIASAAVTLATGASYLLAKKWLSSLPG